MRPKCDEPLSKFAFDFNLRRYTSAVAVAATRAPLLDMLVAEGVGGGLALYCGARRALSWPATLVLAGGVEGVAGAVTAGSVAGASTRPLLSST